MVIIHHDALVRADELARPADARKAMVIALCDDTQKRLRIFAADC
jgi:hypothetical protein